jgi:signal transduction histidine kinase
MPITQIFPIARIRRQFIVPLLLACYGGMFLLDGRAFFARTAFSPSPIALWKQLGFSALSAFLFIAVGTLVWLYARNRAVAWLLLCFCSSMMISFIVSPAAKENDPTFSAIGAVSSGYALLAFSLLLLFFPHNFLEGAGYHRVTRVYLAVLLVGLFASPLYAFFEYILALPLPAWILFGYYGFYLFAIGGILVTIIASYRIATTTRQKHQLRLFVMGVILAFAPALLLTVLPSALMLPAQYIIDSQISTISLVLLPLSLGYSILRYEIMLFDSTLRNAASWILGTLGLGFVIYLMILILGLLGWIFSSTTLIAIILVTFSGIFAWQAMRFFTDHFFFTDQAFYRRAIEHPDVLNADRTNIHTVAHILGGAVARLFDAPHSCLFVLDECSRRYYFVAETTEEQRGSIGQQEILRQMKCQINNEGIAWLDANHPLLHYLQSMTHPLPLSRTLNTGLKQPDGRDPEQTPMQETSTRDPLIAPIFAQGSIIGIIAASARSDQPYAGPDWEAMHLLQARLAPILETARLYEQAHRRAEMMNALYSSNRSDILLSSEELRTTFAQCAADVFSAGAEFWLYDEHSRELKCCIHQGTGPHFLACDLLYNIERMTLTPCFSSRSTPFSPSLAKPDWVPATAPLPASFACLPLECGQHQLGLFVLTFSDIHYFSTEEQRDLLQLASTYASEIDHASMTTELYQAYERQKELDRLKDEFIIIASHELRTPLTSVQGFIDLLINYNDTLDDEKRTHFLTIAQHECDELVHQVNMMLEAGKAQTTAKSVKVQPVSLNDTLIGVQETLAPTLIEEKRTLNLDIPSSLSVLADQIYLRQIFSNLLINALKYSPHGSPLKVWTEQQENNTLIIHIQDYGAGIPPNAQRHIFERFVRLERDMNSPVRGVGLGLPLCKHLLEAMNGQIWVESTGIPGEGSTFSFSLKIPSGEQKPEKATISELNQVIAHY